MKQVSDLAGEREIHEFFSFSGEIEHIEILRWVISIPKLLFFFLFCSFTSLNSILIMGCS